MVVVPPIGTPLSSLPPQVVDSGRSSNGKTADSGSAYRGSNPCLPATCRPARSSMLSRIVFFTVPTLVAATLLGQAPAAEASKPPAEVDQALRTRATQF